MDQQLGHQFQIWEVECDIAYLRERLAALEKRLALLRAKQEGRYVDLTP